MEDDLCPNKTYDYHTAYDIQPTKVVYNVDLDMNRKKILNFNQDKSRNNSAATVKMVKDLEAKLGPIQRIMCIGKYLKIFMISVMLVTIN